MSSIKPTGNKTRGFTTGSIVGLIPGIHTPYQGTPNLGEGLPGLMPPSVPPHDGSASFAQTRFTLKNAWNTKSLCGSSNPKRILTPFRAVNNAGDLLCRQNFSCGGACQTTQSRPNIKGLRVHLGGISNACSQSVVWSTAQLDNSIPAGACNSKYVYDSSSYTVFLKKQATNKVYNDRRFTGGDSATAQNAIRRVRR